MEEKLEQRSRDLKRVVLFGPESTGKTTLARTLAEYFNTEWVPEYSREYLQKKWDEEQLICGREDMLPIAAGQMQLENTLAETAKEVLICDTNLLESVVYSQIYFDGYCPPQLHKHALKAEYDLYLLTYIDIPWINDDLRDKPLQREFMFSKFKDALDTHDLPYRIIRGNYQERFDSAVSIIKNLIGK